MRSAAVWASVIEEPQAAHDKPQAHGLPREACGLQLSSALLGQVPALEIGDALAVVFDGLGGQHAALVILELAIELMGELAGCGDHHIEGLLGDRKSTRLNSSHVKIS